MTKVMVLASISVTCQEEGCTAGLTFASPAGPDFLLVMLEDSGWVLDEVGSGEDGSIRVPGRCPQHA
jgi:hypothetical protein